MSNSTLFFSTPDISNGATYTISSGGTIADYNNLWQGWYDGGVWSGGTTLTTFTPSSVLPPLATQAEVLVVAEDGPVDHSANA